MADENQPSAYAVRLAWIRHEIRNPLNVIVGTLRMLELTGLTPQQQKHVHMGRAAADNIAGILTNLEKTFGVPSVAMESAIALHALGGVSFLTKPFERGTLLTTIHAARPDRGTMRILAADDSPEAGWLLQTLLEGAGHIIEVVPDGEAAVRRAAAVSFDAILLDYEMPGVDGGEAAARIREDESRKGRPHVPIVIVSGHEMGVAPSEPANDQDDGEEEVRPDPEIAPLVPDFLANRRADIAVLRGLVDSKNWEGLRAMGHKMKGTGRGYGFARISDIGRELEEAAREEDQAAAHSRIAALETYLARVRVL